MTLVKKFLPFILVLSLFLAGCKGSDVTPSPATSISNLPTPQIKVESGPDVELAARDFLETWKLENWPALYDKLSKLTRDAMSQEEFLKKINDANAALTVALMDYKILSKMHNPTTAQVGYSIEYSTNLFGPIGGNTLMNLVLEDGSWQVQWEDGMILPQLNGGNRLEVVHEIPTRGSIYDSKGNPLVTYTSVVTIYIDISRIDPKTEQEMYQLVSDLTGLMIDDIRQKAAWGMPIAQISQTLAQEKAAALRKYDSIYLTPGKMRYYVDGGIAPHVLGYVQQPFPEEIEIYRRTGYLGDELIGKSGLEAWGEQYLAGKHGAKIYVKDPSGQVVTMIAKSDPEPSASIYTSIDSGLQSALQKSMGDQKGAIVVVEINTGRILTMASNPPYDPNIFDPASGRSAELANKNVDPNLPFYNRATQGVYPPGSVFKMITMAAALETGVFKPEYTYYCDTSWDEDGYVLYDWTYNRGIGASGTLTLKEGLMRSCNPWFWHIAYSLWNEGYRTAIPDLALGFGLGKPTGIEIPEFKGQVNYPETRADYVQMSIGQSTLQVSPLQMAMYIAAIGNDGTLYRPTLVDKIIPLNERYDTENVVYESKPTEVGKLPITSENLDAIQQSMVWVIRSPAGTANWNLGNMAGDVAGKTGTAENPGVKPHAWFGGYTWNEDPDKPDIAVVIILEHAGEGSEMAAPLFRRAISLYYSDNRNPGGTMPWEQAPYVPLAEETEAP